jgi:hypothetical protein
VVHFHEEGNLTLQVIQAANLTLVDGFASVGETSGAVDAFADTAVVSLAEDLGEDDVIVEDVGEGAGDGAFGVEKAIEFDVGFAAAAVVAGAEGDGLGEGFFFVEGAVLEGNVFHGVAKVVVVGGEDDATVASGR